jgi:outer membrane protein assembly factor BamB/tetratricopeptide (TPR) repeat protein
MPVWMLRLLMLALGLWPAMALGQLLGGSRGGQFELAEQVQLDRADNTVLANLQRAQAYLEDRQWSEAVETLRQVMESAGGMLMPVTERRYVSVRDYCHLRLSQMPKQALALYRSRIDPVARKWYEDGLRRLDRQSLARVVEQAFASSYGDRALWALGEMELEAGDYAAARTAWERILPVETPPGVAATWLCYPDSRIDPAAIRARLVLVSILEGSTERARSELAQFARLHREARGVFGGAEVNYLAALESLLAENAPDRRDRPCDDWPTFAGNGTRSQIAAAVLDVGRVAWRGALRAASREQTPHDRSSSCGAELAPAMLSCHPAAWGNLVAAATHAEVLVFDARTGRPAWGSPVAAAYRDQFDDSPASSDPSDTLGTPHWTVTIHNGRLLARVGTAVTSRPPNSTFRGHAACLVCLDLKAEGRLLWKVYPDEGWAWEGAPLADGANVYVAMRRSDIRPQAYVACLNAQTGQLRWRRFICAADSPAHGVLHESTHQLLTLAGDTLYYSTNLGAVAAVATRDGQIRWVSLYPRSRQGDLARLAPHWQRALTPCVYHRGLLLVAPADSPRIFGLEAATGQILWQTGTQVEDVVHLLGVSDDWLIASGRRLYWISLKPAGQGRVERVWPQSSERLGYGRGILAGSRIYWPARGKIYCFNLRDGEPEKVIDLTPLGVRGGNLIAAGGRLFVATPTELVALDLGGKPRGASSAAKQVVMGERNEQHTTHQFTHNNTP